MKRLLLNISLIFSVLFSSGQNNLDIQASLNIEEHTISITQEIKYYNDSDQTLDTIYLNDWSNSYSTKKTPLAERFTEEFSTAFHFAKSEDRGFTVIADITQNGSLLDYKRVENHVDVIRVKLLNPVAPGDAYHIKLRYKVKLPSDKFTGYGVTNTNDYNLKYWYITPAIFNGKWQYSSNKNLDDMFIPKSDILLRFQIPNNYTFVSELDQVQNVPTDKINAVFLTGKDRVDSKLIITKFSPFSHVQTDDFTVVSDVKENKILATDKALIIDRITQFITKNLSEYPHQKLLLTKTDIDKDPIYGLNQLPDFIRPFPEHFQYELTMLKGILANYLNNVLLINPREEHWLKDAIQVYYLMKYTEAYYPDMKLFGSLANIWGLRSFHAADLKFNDQYRLTYMHMARTNRDQRLTMSKDSLLKFNANIANKYKAGVGFKYLDEYINGNLLEKTIQEFLNQNNTKSTNTKAFELLLKSGTKKNINWFFDDYINTTKKIDYRLKKVLNQGDSIGLVVENKRENSMPVSLYSLKEDSILSKSWISSNTKEDIYYIPKNDADRYALNYQNEAPEFNLRDNYKSLLGLFKNSKPLQIRLFKDFEDPQYNQVFIMPLIEYRNIYDGITLGMKFYNRTVLRKKFNYKFSPKYGTNSGSLTGSGSIFFINNIEKDKDLFNITYGVSGSYNSYAPDLFVRVITPSINFNFRDHDDFRSNEFRSLNVRYLSINRDPDLMNISGSNEPNYSVFNVRYLGNNIGLINAYNWSADLQFAENFGKISFNYLYRKLYQSNRQLELRFFVGSFLYNQNSDDSNYFNFALDRPTDYLFDYNYLGRSESSGIFSQQLIIAEGGFKSQLEPAFANRWIATANFSTSIWRYIQVYGDIGLVKNKGFDPKFVYDSGIRLNLVQDYFEIYFPVYSNLGWEIGQENYDQRIRFLFTVDPQSLLGLFRRKWY